MHQQYPSKFDGVISCENSVPHLLTDEDILQALQAFYACIHPGGGCLISLRDYDQENRGKGIVKTYGIRETDGKRYLVFQVWDFDGPHCNLTFYFLEDDLQSNLSRTHVMRSRYYAISPHHLSSLMEVAGFTDITRLDDTFFQPVLVGTKHNSFG